MVSGTMKGCYALWLSQRFNPVENADCSDRALNGERSA